MDSSTASSGLRSATIAVAGTVNRISPDLQSTSFALSPGRAYTLTASTRSAGVGGTYTPKVWVLELDANDNILKRSNGAYIQHPVSAARGTAGWSTASTTFTTDSRCRRAWVYANVYSGYGTVWVDNIQVR